MLQILRVDVGGHQITINLKNISSSKSDALKRSCQLFVRHFTRMPALFLNAWVFNYLVTTTTGLAMLWQKERKISDVFEPGSTGYPV